MRVGRRERAGGVVDTGLQLTLEVFFDDELVGNLQRLEQAIGAGQGSARRRQTPAMSPFTVALGREPSLSLSLSLTSGR